MTIVYRKWSCVSGIVTLLTNLAVALLAAGDSVTTASDDWTTSGCPARCTCYIAESVISTLPLRTVNCSGIDFSSAKLHLSPHTESLVVSGSRVDLPILTAVLFRDGNQLRELVLSRGYLHSFDGLAAPETLQSVVASHNELVSLPDAAFVRLASLTVLDLSHNRLEVIHRYAFIGLVRLRRLDLSANHLSGAFEGLRWVCELRRLETLSLSHNGIHVLDESTFACSRHPPPPLPRRWSKLKLGDSTSSNASSSHLLVLDLSFNRIRHIHSGAFVGLGRRVDEIRLNDNALLGLPVRVLQMTPDVQVWDLSGNEVEVLETGSFADNHWLRELRLSRLRRLRLVDDHAFINLTSLRRLELSHNGNLRYISRSAFCDDPALTNLVLTDNRLYTLEVEVVDSLPALTELSLGGNPLNCDCTLRSLLRHIQNNSNLNTDLERLDPCSPQPHSPDTTATAVYQFAENSTSLSRRFFADNRSTDASTNSEMTWQSTTMATNGVALNFTETPVEVSASVRNRTSSSRCSPRILALFDSELLVTVTDRLRIDCRAVGFPLPTVSWLLPVYVTNDAGNQVSNIQ